MDMSSSSGRYMDHSPSRHTSTPSSPHNVIGGGFRSAGNVFREEEKYLSDLLQERQKIQPFIQVLPHSYRLLNQEILRVTSLLGNASVLDQTGLEHGSPLTTRQLLTNIGGASTFQSEVRILTINIISFHLVFDVQSGKLSSVCRMVEYMLSGRQRTQEMLQAHLGLELTEGSISSYKNLGLLPSLSEGWLGPEGGSSSLLVKKIIRLDIPVDKYPNYNFVGRLLGPRGNSLKRIEAATGCRVLIRGRGSIKNQVREEMMRGKPGYVHLNEPLHIIIEAELPIEIVDARLTQAREILQNMLTPVDESQDYFKQQQLRELAILNGTLREDGSHSSGSLSPFHDNLGMKRAKTRD